MEEKQRIIQEYVPGKQVTLAHIIANPDASLYRKIGARENLRAALGILTITPSEAAIIAADLAIKAAQTDILFVDRFSGSLVISGDVSNVEAAIKEILNVLQNVMGFSSAVITRT